MATPIIPTPKSFVYVIQAQGTAMCKIGVTIDVQNRLRQMQTGCPHKLVVLAVWSGPLRLEKLLHHDLREYRREGEWFEFPPFSGLMLYRLVQGYLSADIPAVKPVAVKKVVKRARRGKSRRPPRWVGEKKWGYSQGLAVPAGCEIQYKPEQNRFAVLHREELEKYRNEKGKLQSKRKRLCCGFLTWEERNSIKKLSVAQQRNALKELIEDFQRSIEKPQN